MLQPSTRETTYFSPTEGGNIFSVEFPQMLSEEGIGVFKSGIGNAVSSPNFLLTLSSLRTDQRNRETVFKSWGESCYVYY